MLSDEWRRREGMERNGGVGPLDDVPDGDRTRPADVRESFFLSASAQLSAFFSFPSE